MHYLLKEDLLKCEQFSKQARILGAYSIGTKEELASFITEKKSEYEKFYAKREELRKLVRRVMPEEKRTEIKEEIAELTRKLKHLRGELRLSADILERSDGIKEKLERIDKEQEQRKEERER